MNRLPVNPLIMRALQLAEEELGLDELAHRLGVTPATIDDWRFGFATMPQDKFLELVDVLNRIDPRFHRKLEGTSPTPAPAGGPRRILVVDDNGDAAVALTHLLELLGHDATAVIDPRRALDIARELQPEIAILDLNMPYVSGLELARLFRQEAGLEKTRLVVLTAMDGEDYRAKTREAGFEAHLRKPADAAVLRKLIAELEPR